MSTLVWDKVGDRSYETGLDRGVLYLADGKVIPWNGLTEIVESVDIDTSPVYYDGMKIYDLVSLGDFSASMKAVTYPDEFVELEGYGSLREGLFLGNQAPKTFGLSYRTRIGNDVDGDNAGYNIHIIYNVIAVPNDRTRASVEENTQIIEFEWDIVAAPEEVPGFRPTAHIIINSINLEPELLKYIEEKLYGTEEVEASLILISDLISYMYTWARIEIVDNGDGTWIANFIFDEDLDLNPIDQSFTIVNANAIYSDLQTYRLSSTLSSTDI